MAHGIKSIVEGVAGANGPGERLTMADGSIWFRPYGGAAPICEYARRNNPDDIDNHSQQQGDKITCSAC